MPLLPGLLTSLFKTMFSPQEDGRSPCAAMETHRAAFLEDPAYRARYVAFDTRMRLQATGIPPGATIKLKVPVIVHLVSHLESKVVSLKRVEEQIDVLNDCFAGRNDTSGVPGQFQPALGTSPVTFFLPTHGHDGHPIEAVRETSAPGQTFTVGTHAEQVKAVSPPADTKRYLNVWVCNFASHGHATFPNAPSDHVQGVVVHYECFGKTGNKGAERGHTLVHEVGHWLGLIHLWGDDPNHPGTDLVDDTPDQPAAHRGKWVCGCDPAAPDTAAHMFMNFMDYTPDKTRCFFTKQQMDRMFTALTKERRDVLWT